MTTPGVCSRTRRGVWVSRANVGWRSPVASWAGRGSAAPAREHWNSTRSLLACCDADNVPRAGSSRRRCPGFPLLAQSGRTRRPQRNPPGAMQRTPTRGRPSSCAIAPALYVAIIVARGITVRKGKIPPRIPIKPAFHHGPKPGVFGDNCVNPRQKGAES